MTEITPFRQAPYNPPPKARHANQGVVQGRPTRFNHQQHIPQVWERQERTPLPNPRTQETAATRSRSTSSRLAFRNAAPERVLARHHRCAMPSQSRTMNLLHPVRWDMPPVLMSIPV